MDLIDRLKDLSARVSNQLEYIQTEEAAKNAIVLPLLSALGYDVFNPLEVIPEFTADVGLKKGEKVDYAIQKEGQVIFLIECKAVQTDLNEVHANQLYRYFSVTETRFSILTNGLSFWFYSDIDEPNKMDAKPFFIFDLLNFTDHHIDELKRFSKAKFDLGDILDAASSLKYTGAIKKVFDGELQTPTDDFVRFFASRVYSGRLTQGVMEQFRGIVKSALNQNIRERISERFKSALDANSEQDSSADESESLIGEEDGIVTTQDEVEGYNIVKSICREVVAPERVFMRDTKSYCGILLDDNNRKTIVRLRFNGSKYWLGIIKAKEESKFRIDKLDNIFDYSDQIKETVLDYLNTAKEDEYGKIT